MKNTNTYELGKVTYYFQYHYDIAKHYGLPLAKIVTANKRYDPLNGYDRKDMMVAHKAWCKVGDNPIEVVKCRDGNYNFDEDEFIQMLFVAEEMPPSLSA